MLRKRVYIGGALNTVPNQNELAAEFNAAAEIEPAVHHLAEVYRTGIMYEVNGQPVKISDTPMGLPEGLILWHLACQLQPSVIVETGFGRGGSAAFFLAALQRWSGTLISIDPAFRHWAQDIGTTYIDQLGLSAFHRLIEQPSELALASMIAQKPAENLRLSYIDGSHHFDGTLIDFTYLDRLTEVGGIIAMDDANAPAVRTVASFVANNLSYQLHYATTKLVLCKKLAQDNREWWHFKPFQSSPKSDWNLHEEHPDAAAIPGVTFGDLCA